MKKITLFVFIFICTFNFGQLSAEEFLGFSGLLINRKGEVIELKNFLGDCGQVFPCDKEKDTWFPALKGLIRFDIEIKNIKEITFSNEKHPGNDDYYLADLTLLDGSKDRMYIRIWLSGKTKYGPIKLYNAKDVSKISLTENSYYKCPLCNRLLSLENSYCPFDGTKLIK